MPEDLWSDDEWRAAMSAADINDLPDSAFAYIEPGGEKDESGKTTPRSKRHFPIHDAAHVRNALARLSQSPFGDKAKDAVMAAAKKFGIKASENKSADEETTAPSRVKKPRHRAGPATGLEVRHFVTGQLECRDDGSNNLQLVGTPIVYNTPYDVRDMFGTFSETMKPGVVTDLLKNGTDTRFLLNHSGLPLARTTSRTLKLEDSPIGLRCTVNLDARQQLATDLYVAAERGDITQMSVGMIVGEDNWPDNETREISKLKALEDVSAVTYPASPTTDIAVAQRMLYEMPVESRERVRRMWAITRDLHDGRPVEQADIDVLSDGLRALAEADADEVTADEVIERAAPSPQDKGILAKIKNAHSAVADAIHAQAGDSDNATDKIDPKIMGKLQDAHKAVSDALALQGIDGAPEGATCPACGDENRADANFCSGCGAPIEPAGALAGNDGTIGVPSTSSDGNSTSAAYDNTGIRMTKQELQRELLEIELRRQRPKHYTTA